MRTVKHPGVAGALAVAASIAFGATHAFAADTSSVCFDEGLYAKGAVVDFDAKISGDGSPITIHAVNTGKGDRDFNGVSALAVDSESFDKKGKSEGVVTGYYDFAPGFLLIVGTESKAASSTFDPAGRQPIDQKVGDTYKQKYKMTTTSKGVGTQTITRTATWKFAGFETFKSKVGKFKVCKLTAKFVDAIGSFSTVTNQTSYIAAEGKYRGFALRTKTSGKLVSGQTINTTQDVIKFRKFKPK